MSLIPSSETDKARLKEIGIKGYVYPLDEALGLSHLPFKITIAAMLEIAKESSRCESYEEAEQILREKTMILVNDDTIRLVTNEIGRIVFDNDMKSAEALWKTKESGRLEFPKKKKENVLYLEIDGAMLPTRQIGVKGTVFKENKLGMVFSDDKFYYWTDKQGKRHHRIKEREYISLIGDAKTFTILMFYLVVKNGYGTYKTTVLISDGATWIRNLKDYIFPEAQQILDFYHLREHTTNYFKEVYNFNEDKYQKISDLVCDLFKSSQTSEALDVIKKSAKKKDTDLLEKFLTYLDNNKDNIDYATYRSKGYFIESGAIESSNKTVLQRRLKYGAMRWIVDSAQAVVSLVAKARSDRWESDVVQAVYEHYGQKFPASLLQKLC
jgi:hypothetical protein